MTSDIDCRQTPKSPRRVAGSELLASGYLPPISALPRPPLTHPSPAVREALGWTRGGQVRAYFVALGFLLVTVNGLAACKVIAVSPPPVTLAAAIVGGLVFGVGMVAGKG